MNQFELFSREKLLFLYQLSEIWDDYSRQQFIALAQHPITKQTMIKCKVDVEKEINEDGCNYMLHPEVDVKIIIEIFRKDFREDFLVNHAEICTLEYIDKYTV